MHRTNAAHRTACDTNQSVKPSTERKCSTMNTSFDDAGKYGKEFMDNGLKSLASFSKGLQAIAVETTEYAKKSFETGSAALEKLVAAKSLEKAIEVQSDYAKQAYEGFVAEATKIGDLYAELFKDTYKPFEAVGVKTK
jgi:hypothetical protein